MKAVWCDAVIAESNDIVTVEGNAYFPMSSVNANNLQASDTTSVCPWKGTASYFSIVVDGKINTDAVWVYQDPKPEAVSIANRVAFWKGVEVSE